MYQGDSFFTLSTAGQAGLAALSLILSVAILVLTRRLAGGRPLIWRIAIWALLFFLFVWLSPQVYYTYYRMIIPDLPLQWVIRWPDVPETLALMAFMAGDSLSAHGKGVLGWAMLAAAVWPVRAADQDDCN